ncbi:tetratricopeptide repeat protein [Stakelama tenebrarum]|uniref:Tetratricopeptide repeat protein n=1 Tax=Stakelama tenebrarum TaxID=2711215 RepID=A0A6G6Y6P7_9SPHN|nr:tetratricopeptide repeat protein [Sphingosinithalassobacter tenebrarum]QIG80579.1 tetratricopeptide repeat protein [Sphingosinithalassobacter tenebrarum]
MRKFTCTALLLGALPALPLPAAAAAQVEETQPNDGGQQDRAAQDRDALNAAMAHIRAGEPARAIPLLDPLLARFDAENADETRNVYCAQNQQMMILYSALGRQAEGNRDTQVLDSTWCTALWMKGFALIDLERPEEALGYYRRATELSPFSPQYFVELGYAYKELGQWEESAKAYRQAAEGAQMAFQDEERDRWLRRAWYGEAYAFIELGRWAEAEALLRKCLEVAPGDEKVLSELRYIAENRTDGK